MEETGHLRLPDLWKPKYYVKNVYACNNDLNLKDSQLQGVIFPTYM